MTRLNAVKKSAIILLAPLVLLVAVALCAPIGWVLPASANTQAPKVPDGPPAQVQFQLLHSFGAAGDGASPGAGLVMDGMGNLYGATGFGGAYGYGTVYELSPSGNGQWTETVLYSFMGPPDGYEPNGLAIDGAGNLYGATAFGGDGQYCGDNICGVLFELSPGSNGEWTESILYDFCSLPNCADGVASQPPKIGPGGVLYGIAANTAYALTPGSGGWTINVLYTFCDTGLNCPDGEEPSGAPVLDKAGNLYGETIVGGQCTANPAGCGVAYELQKQPNGQWDEIVLYVFQEGSNRDGANPQGGLAARDGGLYGVAMAGGEPCILPGGCGTIFELTRGSGQMANEQTIWSFGGENGMQGFGPTYGPTFNRQGDLFGVTPFGGSPSCGCGVVYGMKQQKNGQWAYQVLHAFDGTDGYDPGGLVLVDAQGDLFGVTGGGGQYGAGVAYEISPTAQQASK